MNDALDISSLRLKKHVGIFVDRGYERPDYISDIIAQVKSGTVIATSEMPEVTEFILQEATKRSDIHIKLFQNDPWDRKVYTEDRASRIRDYLFLSFMKFQRGRLLLFPKKFQTEEVGRSISVRMQDMMVTAHQMGVVYDIITA